MTADIVIAHVSANKIALSDIEGLIASVYRALANAGAPSAPKAGPIQEPAVSIRASIKPDHLVCLEDGKTMKMLKRYLMGRYGLTPDAYRTKWNLPNDYPMVAPGYAARRREIALQTGLGRSGKSGRKKVPVGDNNSQ